MVDGVGSTGTGYSDYASYEVDAEGNPVDASATASTEANAEAPALCVDRHDPGDDVFEPRDYQECLDPEYAQVPEFQRLFEGGVVGQGAGVGVEGGSDAVRLIQRQLYKADVLPASSGPNNGMDGEFGPGTARAVKKFQQETNVHREAMDKPLLPETGEVDHETLLALQNTPLKRAMPPTDPLTERASSYLKSADERDAYNDVKRELRTGWGDWAVTNEETTRALDRLDELSPEAYSNVLHALAATPYDGNDAKRAPTYLDKMIVSGTSHLSLYGGHTALSERFVTQLTTKMGEFPEPDRQILGHISPDSTSRLKSWAALRPLVEFFGG